MATLERRSFADMARILTEEAIALREFPDILFTDGPTGRRATFRHGPDVWEVLEPYVLGGRDWGRLRRSYPELGESLLRTAVRYYESGIAKKAKGAAYTIHPANAVADYQWKVKEGLTIKQEPSAEEKLDALQERVDKLEKRLEELEKKKGK